MLRNFICGCFGGLLGVAVAIWLGYVVSDWRADAQTRIGDVIENSGHQTQHERPVEDAPLKPEAGSVTGVSIVGNSQGGVAAEIIGNGQHGAASEIDANGYPGQSVTGLSVTQIGPGTGLRVVQTGPGTGLRITATSKAPSHKP